MATITASMVKDLREKTGAGMMDCKTALTENGGDLEQAVDWLKTKGLAKAAKKAGRVAAEGLIAVRTEGGTGVVVEVNSETDFVARNAQFQDMVTRIGEVALATDGSVDAIKAAEFPGAGKSVEDHITDMVATIGENMSLRRATRLEVGKGVVAGYVHSAAAEGLGRIGVIVALESEGDAAALATFGKQVAMHVAATAPLALASDDLDAAVVDRERSIFAEQARESGKPDNIVEKMVEGRIRKYYQEVVLMEQTFVIDPDKTVKQAAKDAEASVGAPITVKAFERYALGEGIEKQGDDFAAEVAAMSGKG